jgi:FMNH2-dependent dimethyl sulfone monooxygenase
MVSKERQRTSMFNANKFKLGLFAPNCSCGLAMTTVPERWDGSWENNVKAAHLAEEAGVEFVLPIARWHGFDGGKVTAQESALETVTWATGLLASTSEISVFGTVHVPLISPVFAAKQIVTADHISNGRFGLNVVSGWNKIEFGMFGVEMRDHDRRYDYTTEWVEIITRIWSDQAPFDYDGEFFRLEGVTGWPKPLFGDRPLLLSAGSSTAGRAFAARHADCLFMVIVDDTTLAEEITALRAAANKLGKDIGVYASGHIVCRASQKEAEEYYEYYAVEMADHESVDTLLRIRLEGGTQSLREAIHDRRRLASGLGTFPIVGDPDFVDAKLSEFSDAGLNGMAFGLVNYVDELPLIAAELLPRMERLGIRQAS